MTSILVETSEAIASALSEHEFGYGPFTANWDYEKRLPDTAIEPEKLDVSVIVPRSVEEAIRFTQSTMRYAAAYDIDVRYKFAQKSQAADAPLVGKDVLAKLSALVEDIHHFCFSSPLFGEGGDLQWVAKDEELGVESKILIAYSPKFLRENRMFYGVCREYFYKVR